tara:strand:- start:125 stop:376 length:252 start_codon:yes stop_codon:yes gene_type:complete
MSDDRFSMNTFDGLLGTTEAVVEKMIDGDISPREADIVLKAVSTARAVLEAKNKAAPSAKKNPETAPSISHVSESGPFGLFNK